jgi:hypothetical protein
LTLLPKCLNWPVLVSHHAVGWPSPRLVVDPAIENAWNRNKLRLEDSATKKLLEVPASILQSPRFNGARDFRDAPGVHSWTRDVSACFLDSEFSSDLISNELYCRSFHSSAEPEVPTPFTIRIYYELVYYNYYNK